MLTVEVVHTVVCYCQKICKMADIKNTIESSPILFPQDEISCESLHCNTSYNTYIVESRSEPVPN